MYELEGLVFEDSIEVDAQPALTADMIYNVMVRTMSTPGRVDLQPVPYPKTPKADK